MVVMLRWIVSCCHPLFFLLYASCAADQLRFLLRSSKLVRTVSNEFLSIGIDSSITHRHFCGLNFSKAALLAAPLKPVYLRIGGTEADQLVFVANGSLCENSCTGCIIPPPRPLPNTTFLLTGSDLSTILEFAYEASWNVVFDLNALFFNAGNSWHSSNTEALLNFTSQRSYALNFELGNEPNSFYHNFNVTIGPAHLANRYRKLRALLNCYPMYHNSFIVGPSVSRPTKSAEYLKGFLSSDTVTDAISFHSYYVNGRTATLEQFLEPKIFEQLRDEINIVRKLRQLFPDQKHKPLWLGETADAYGGGARHLSDTYAAGFMWLDKLGLAATLGLDVVVKQSFYYGYYGLLDEHSNPRPNYWTSLLYKQLVGTKVLSLRTRLLNSSKLPYLRFYASCSRVPKGNVVIYGMNLLNNSIRVSFDSRRNNPVALYLLTPPNQDLTSVTMQLNGNELRLHNGVVPKLKPKYVAAPFSLPPRTYVFFVVKPTKQNLCRR